MRKSSKTEHTLNFTILGSKDEYDKRFNEIKRIPESWTTEQIIKEISSKLSLTLIVAREIPTRVHDQLPIYRARVVPINTSFDEHNIKEYGCPPPEYCNLGRANKAGIPVFYGSADRHTTFHEVITKEMNLEESIVYLSKWKVKDYSAPIFIQNIFFGVDGDQENYASYWAKGIDEWCSKLLGDLPEQAKENILYYHQLYQDLFTYSGEDYYHISSSIVDDVFSHSNELNIPIVAYPSVPKSKQSINWAIRRDFAEKQLELVEVDKLKITNINEERVIVNPISRGFVKEGIIKWTFPKIEIRKIDYSSVEITTLGNNKFHPLPSGDKTELTSCCVSHGFTLVDFLAKHNYNEEMLKRGIQNVPLSYSDFVAEEVFNFTTCLEISGNLFTIDNVSESNKIKMIKIPVTYSLSYS